MSLRMGMLTLVEANGEERELRLSGKIFRIGSYLSCDLVLDNPEARSVHCEIQSDSFGRITITNHSKSNPVRINGVPLKGTRPLYTGSVITIFEKNLKWVHKHCLPRCKVDIEKLPTPMSYRRRTEQAPNSEPSILVRRKPILKRITIHNLGSRKDLTDEDEEVDVCKIDDEEDTRQELLTRASMISAAKTFGATPPRSSKRASTTISRRLTDTYDSINMKSTECKENVSITDADSKNMMLLKCQSSGLVVTSYSPSVTPIKSFACVMSTKTTPKSCYGTPRSAMSDLNTDGFLENKITPKTPSETCSMFLMDFTTPDHYRTPLQKRTPLFRSAIKNSATKTLPKANGKNGDLFIPNSVTPASNKKIRWEISNSTLKSEKSTPLLKQTEFTKNTSANKSIGSRSSVKNSSNRLSNYTANTPPALTRQRTLTSSAKSSISVSKLKPSLRRKSLNLSMPLKTPKAIFSDTTSSGLKFNRDLSGKVKNTPHSAQKSAAAPNSACSPLKTFNRSATFIVGTPTTSKGGTLADEVISKSQFVVEDEIMLNDTLCKDHSEVQSVERSQIDEPVRTSTANDLEEALQDPLTDETNCCVEVNENLSITGSERKSVSAKDITITPVGKRSSRTSGSLSKIQNSVPKYKEHILESSPSFEANKTNTSARYSHGSLKKSLAGVDSTPDEFITEEKIESESLVSQRRSSLRRSCNENSLNVSNLETTKESIASPSNRPSILQSDANKKNSKRLSFSVTNTDSIDSSVNEEASFIAIDSTNTRNKIVPKLGTGLKRRKSLRLSQSAESDKSAVTDELQSFHHADDDGSDKTVELNAVSSTITEGSPHSRPEHSPIFIGVKELLKTPRPGQRLENLKGVRELFNTPARDDLSDVRGVKELIKTPKSNSERIMLYGVKELFNTPARDDLTNVVGVKELLIASKPGKGLEDPKGLKELFNSMKSPKGIVDVKGIRELFKSPQQETGICDVSGVREIFKTPKPTAGLDGKSTKELFKTPKDPRGSDDVQSLQELFHTPTQAIDVDINGAENLFKTFSEGNMLHQRFDELLKTPKTTPTISAGKEVMKTPHMTNDDVDDLNEIFKSPGSRKVMVVSTPNSVVVERVSNLSGNLLRTPKEVDVLEGIEEAEEIFNSPVSNLIYSCTESDQSENMSPQQSFDKLVGKPVLRRTYERKSATPRILPIPIAEENHADGVRTDIQEWIDNVITEKQSESTNKSRTSAVGLLASPAAKASRKPLATSSSIKPPLNSGNTKQCPNNGINLNEVSGIEQLDDSFLSSTEISDVLVTNDGNCATVASDETISKTIQQILPNLITPQKSKLKNDLSKHVLKVTPQIRRLKGNFSTPYSRKSSKAMSIKDLDTDCSIQYIDESSISIFDSKGSVISPSKRETRSRNRNFSSLDDVKSVQRASDTIETSEVEFLSTSGSIGSLKSRKTPQQIIPKSGGTIFISDDESSSYLAKQNASNLHLNSKIPEKTLEFVAMDELSESSIKCGDHSVVDALRSLPNALLPCEAGLDQLENTVDEVSRTANATSEEVRKSVSYEEEEENLLNLYDTQFSNQELECRTFEVVYVDSNSVREKSTKEHCTSMDNISADQSRRPSKGQSGSMSYNFLLPENSSIEREEALPDNCMSASKETEDDVFVNFVENPRIGKHVRRISHTPSKSIKINIKKANARFTLGSAAQSDPIDVTAEKIRREFSNFNLNPVVRLVRGTSQIQLKPSRSTVSRRTVGNLPLNPCFDLQSEKNRRDISIEFENFQEAGSGRDLRSRTLSPAKKNNPEKNRRTMGQTSLAGKPFDYQNYSRNKRSGFEHFVSDKAPIINSKRHTLNIKNATKGATGKSRHSLGDRPIETTFNIQLEKDRRNLSLDFQNFEKQPTIKHVRGRSAIIDFPISGATVNRRTVGGKPISEHFDLRREVEQSNLERELEKMDNQNRHVLGKRGQSESPKNDRQVINLPNQRFSVGQVPMSSPLNRKKDSSQSKELENSQLIQSSENQECNKSGLVMEEMNSQESETNDKRNNFDSPSQEETHRSEEMPLPTKDLVECSPSRSTEDTTLDVGNNSKSISNLESTPVEKIGTASRRVAKKVATETELTVPGEYPVKGKTKSAEKKSQSDYDPNEKHVRFGETVYYEIEKNGSVESSAIQKKVTITQKQQRKGTASNNVVEKGLEVQPPKGRKVKRTGLSETVENCDLVSNSNELEKSSGAGTEYHGELFNASDENKENNGRVTRRGRKLAPTVEANANSELNQLKNQMEALAPRPRRGNKRKDIADNSNEQVNLSPNKAEAIRTRNKRDKIGGSDEVDKSVENETNVKVRAKAAALKNAKTLSKDEFQTEQLDIIETVAKTKNRRGKRNQAGNDLTQLIEKGQDKIENLEEIKTRSDEKLSDSIDNPTSVQLKGLSSTQNENKEKSKLVSKSKKGAKTEGIIVEENLDQNEEIPPVKAGKGLDRLYVTATNFEVRSSPRIKPRLRKDAAIAHEDPVTNIQNKNSGAKTSRQKKIDFDDHDDFPAEKAPEQQELEHINETKTRTRNLRRHPKTTENIESEQGASRKTRKTEKQKQEIEAHEDQPVIKENNQTNARNDSKPKARNTRLKSKTESNVESKEHLEDLLDRDTGRLHAVEQQSPNESNSKRRTKRNQTKLQISEPNLKPNEKHPDESRFDNAEDVFKTPNEVKPKLRATRLKSTSDTPSNVETENVILPKRTRRLVSTDTLKTQESTPEIATQAKPRAKRLKSTDTQNETQHLENDNPEQQSSSSGNSARTRNKRGRKANLLNVSTENISTPTTSAEDPTTVKSEKETKTRRGRQAKSKPAPTEIPAEGSTPTKQQVGRSNKRKVEIDVVESNVSPKRTRSRRK